MSDVMSSGPNGSDGDDVTASGPVAPAGGTEAAGPVDAPAPADEPPAAPPAAYRVLSPYLAYGNARRPVEGDVVDDIPEESIGWLLEDGLIEKA